ncbi:MAG: hypothetical protein EAZ39_02455 [Oscillatoriales cyanobacterium]|uniref:hypothetical protein n=1 Tax=Microcoleus sp. PH2017_05_CCC_O_A TaxID=2798816 RepID=UPI001DFB61BB|nr:hypothetical protein [Microcoleus sp. PH2017_05_CCC_O_A]TAG02589.1 MAG: hypothetical protein EAZ45_11350 [Oscillatoriales cyanobacterium]MCC3437252.1 hypothetical protein [Microcoleus sp. PH2017_05_CCC_O_A]TAG22537.1 MAG: hypothetical protein EAZ39_02455 [Oscillatoriales cyanobacterium]TAG36040.1 MAG: hypothetical protein EAZ33_24715 [Oscillatoriales cyanobacterium]TAG52012.1 MAG: hypothetical protein EAZ28_30290 [Oscillatoriales cyanobacterium]
MDIAKLDAWYSQSQRRAAVSLLMKRVGVTRTRAECFVRLWIYLSVKQLQESQPRVKPPLTKLELPATEVQCTHREAAELFYSDSDRGSDRAAGMMLDKLEALGLIEKHFDGNATAIQIQPIPEILDPPKPENSVKLKLDDFNPRCDAIPVANLLASYYNWMNRSTNAVPQKIAKVIRLSAAQYSKGMRVLRRCDNLNPVGFYLLYPTASESDVNFFSAPSKSLHLSSVSDIDPFKMALPGDRNCQSVFVRCWVIDPKYLEEYRITLIEDVQKILVEIQTDFPNLCDLYTLIIHPSYEKMSYALGFQKTNSDAQLSLYWMYLALDRFLALDIKEALKNL